MQFTWINQDDDIPVEPQKDERSSKLFKNAFFNFQTTFHESLNSMSRHLKQHNVVVSHGQSERDVKVSSNKIAKLLNTNQLLSG